ncbi:unnamed protein product, partial [Laminaria digitata]
MEALLLLESCLDPKWLKPWYRPAQQKMQSTSYLLRLSTPAAVGLHLFALDRAILYDKVLVILQNARETRGRGGGGGGRDPSPGSWEEDDDDDDDDDDDGEDEE